MGRCNHKDLDLQGKNEGRGIFQPWNMAGGDWDQCWMIRVEVPGWGFDF